MLDRTGPRVEDRLCFIGHGLMEDRSVRLVDTRLTRISAHAERLAKLEMIADRPHAITLSADRGYDAAVFVKEFRALNVQPSPPLSLPRSRLLRSQAVFSNRTYLLEAFDDPVVALFTESSGCLIYRNTQTFFCPATFEFFGHSSLYPGVAICS